ncbi:MAG: hypothetical protein ABIP14_02675, partial [Blastocatellia bacterium]
LGEPSPGTADIRVILGHRPKVSLTSMNYRCKKSRRKTWWPKTSLKVHFKNPMKVLFFIRKTTVAEI